jgi:hypothetical protein
VQILGSTAHPEALFMQQIVRTLTMGHDGAVHTPNILICDRDRKWSDDVRRRLHLLVSASSVSPSAPQMRTRCMRIG